MFTPGLTKRLKLYAMKVAEEKGVDKDHLVDFIDVSFLSVLS
jgi:hypothetical protein